MDSIIDTFHLDWKLFLAQVINFAIVFAILYYFAIKPILKIMQGRTKRIEESLEHAKLAEEKLALVKKEQKEIITSAKQEASNIINEARRLGEQKKNEMVVSVKEEIGQVINQEKAKMQTEKAKIIKEIKGDIANLVTASIEKILEKKMNSEEDKELINKLVK